MMRSPGKGVCQPQCESVKVLSPEINPCCIGPRVSFSGSQHRYARYGEWIREVVMSNERLTGAMLDRLTHKVHIIEANGDSYRLEQSRKRLARQKKRTDQN